MPLLFVRIWEGWDLPARCKMPPSPSLRVLRSSPGRELRTENAHKRGRSFESGLPLKAKDEDLTLFNDVLNKERDNFLLHTSDDFEDSISKLSYFSDFKLGFNIPVRGESSDLLNTDGEKNDYDWLLTPPDTPLFPSLDEDERQPAYLLPRGRPRSQPISVSRSSTSERTHRTSRTSASPQRLSPSPRSTSSLAQLRGRPSSVPHSSPPPVLRATTPSRRPSTPPNKPSSPSRRSSTPTIRRMSTGSSGPTSSPGRTGTSPIKASRGNSTSPKLRGWQASLDGFSTDAPPNLRTSLLDRPTSYTRGSSPSSKNWRDTSSKFRRHSMSPTSSRATSSSHIQEQDLFSTYSKCSAASSGGDDVLDSQHSVLLGMTTQKNGEIVNNKATTFSKKPSITISACSAPKGSFDSALRRMDHHKTPQNMFRPLLSSFPTTIYVGKSSSTQRPMFSRNSSLTTSSNASSEQGVSIAPDIEGSDQEYNDLACEWERTLDTEIQDEMFIFDRVDEINEDDCHEIFAGNSENNDKKVPAGVTYEVDPQVFETSMGNFGIATSLDSYTSSGHSVLVSYEMMATNPIREKQYCKIEVNGNTNSCQECTDKDSSFTAGSPGTVLPMHQDEPEQSETLIKMDKLCSALHINDSVPELSEKSCSGVKLDQYEITNECDHDFVLHGNSPQAVINQREQNHSEQQLERLQYENATQNISEKKQQSQHIVPSDLRIGVPEATGISVLLLQRSSSSKWPFVQGRNFSATNIPCLQPSYARDNTDTMKCSIGLDSASTSSVDLGAYKQKEDHMQHQLSSKGCEVDKMASYADAQIQNSDFHLEVSIKVHEAVFHTKSEYEENLSGFTEVVEHETFQDNTYPLSVNIDIVHADSYLITNTSESQVLSHQVSIHLPDTSVTDSLEGEDCTSCVSSEEKVSENSFRNTPDIKALNEIQNFFLTGENHFLNDSTTCANDKYYDGTKSPPGMSLEQENDHNISKEIQTETIPSENPSDMEASHEPSVFTTSESNVLDSSIHSNIPDQICGIHEEPYITVEGPRGHMSRCLTLEEAADSILFCSSIIHDLAYKAANIGMEKELMLLEGSRPTVTLLGNCVSKQNDPGNWSDKNMPKSQKFKRKELETITKTKGLETNTKATELVNNVKVEECTPFNEGIPNKSDCLKPQKLESKCNCTIM